MSPSVKGGGGKGGLYRAGESNSVKAYQQRSDNRFLERSLWHQNKEAMVDIERM